MNYSEEELKKIIEDTYGFKKELVQKPELCGLWYLRFQVNGIKYYGWTSHAGAVPQLMCEGYTTPYHDNYGTPVTEEHYNRCIKDRKIRLIRITDRESGDWADTGMRFESQEEVENFIQSLPCPLDYQYDFLE